MDRKTKQVEFSNHITKCRGLAGLTRQQVADLFCVNINTVSNWELGNTMPADRGTVIFREDVMEKMTLLANKAFTDRGSDERIRREGGK